jgi:hypothetical protein
MPDSGGCPSLCCRLNPPDRRALGESFGQALSRLLMERDISQYRLCQLTGLGADTVCRLVHDIRSPTEVQALRICLGLNLDNKDANRLLEAADFYPLPDPGHYRPTGRPGWPRGKPRVHVGIPSITQPGKGR